MAMTRATRAMATATKRARAMAVRAVATVTKTGEQRREEK
jgi:hypothetical protein